MKRTGFLVAIHKSEYGYDASCPSLPGCVSQGETRREALENIRSAIQEYLEAVPHTLKAILKGAGISEREFQELI